jgi:hypothetical protein
MPVQPRWSPDGQWLAIYWMRAQPPPKPDLGYWEVRGARTGALRAKGNGEEPIRWAPGGGPAPISSLAWFPDSKRIVLAYPSAARVVDTASGTRQERIRYGWTSATGLTVSPDGKWLGVAAWVRNESLLFALKRGKKLVLPYRSEPYSFSPGGVVFVDTTPNETLVFAAREPGGNYALKRLSFERGKGPPPIEACKIGPYLLPRAACAGP